MVYTLSVETVSGVVDGRGLLACKSDHPSWFEATESAPLISGTLENSRLRFGQDVRLRNETHLSCCHSVVSGARGATGPGLQQCCGYLECGLHYLWDVQSKATVSGHIGSESTRSHLRVRENNSEIHFESTLIYISFFAAGLRADQRINSGLRASPYHENIFRPGNPSSLETSIRAFANLPMICCT